MAEGNEDLPHDASESTCSGSTGITTATPLSPLPASEISTASESHSDSPGTPTFKF